MAKTVIDYEDIGRRIILEYSFNFKDQVVMITGAAMGIGKEMARGFAQFGGNMVLLDMNREEGEKTAKLINDEGGAARFYEVDVTDSERVNTVVSDVIDRFGRIDVLVNNVGTNKRGSVAEQAEDEWKRIIEVNLFSVFIVSQAVIPTMIKQKSGRIINVASAAAFAASPNMSAYCASKAGVVAMTKVMALELTRHNILVNAIAPGYLSTPLTERLRKDPKLYAALVKANPQRRFAEAYEVVGPTLLLASPMASFIGGACINIDGGVTAQ